MDPDLWTVYRKLAGVAISLGVFISGVGFLANSFYWLSVGAFNAETVGGGVGLVMALGGLGSAVLLASSIRARAPPISAV